MDEIVSQHLFQINYEEFDELGLKNMKNLHLYQHKYLQPGET